MTDTAAAVCAPDATPAARVRDLMRRMPKVELHVHLEGTMSAERLRAIAARDGLDIDPRAYAAADTWDPTFAAFLAAFLPRYYALCRPDDYAAVLDDLLQVQAAQNVPYTEAYATFEGALRGRYVLRDVLAAMAEVASDWRRRGVAVRLLVDAPRTLPPEVCEAMFRLAAADPTGLCVGVGIGGPEADNPAAPFAAAFRFAAEAGLRRTAHAGEHAPARAVAQAVDLLGAERIGHGCSAATDAALLGRLRDLGVAVDCCPISNRCTGAWDPQRDAHPMRRFVDAGVTVDVGSDDPAIFGTTLTEEWTQLVLVQGFSPHECLQLTADAVAATFLEPEQRQRLRAQFEADIEDLREEAAALEEALAAGGEHP